jgi:hypothetical protein
MFEPSRLILPAIALFITQAHAGLILNFFPVSAYNANSSTMDATLGTMCAGPSATIPPGMARTG